MLRKLHSFSRKMWACVLYRHFKFCKLNKNTLSLQKHLLYGWWYRVSSVECESMNRLYLCIHDNKLSVVLRVWLFTVQKNDDRFRCEAMSGRTVWSFGDDEQKIIQPVQPKPSKCNRFKGFVVQISTNHSFCWIRVQWVVEMIPRKKDKTTPNLTSERVSVDPSLTRIFPFLLSLAWRRQPCESLILNFLFWSLFSISEHVRTTQVWNFSFVLPVNHLSGSLLGNRPEERHLFVSGLTPVNVDRPAFLQTHLQQVQASLRSSRFCNATHVCTFDKHGSTRGAIEKLV